MESTTATTSQTNNTVSTFTVHALNSCENKPAKNKPTENAQSI